MTNPLNLLILARGYTTSLDKFMTYDYIKTLSEIEGVRKAGIFNSKVMDYLRQFIKKGISTLEINDLADEFILKHGHKSACLNYRGFPKSICTSINNVACHGIPSEKDTLKSGDIVDIDFATIVEGFYADQAETFLVGDVSADAKYLVEVTKKAFLLGIATCMSGNPITAIADTIDSYASSRNCSVVHEYGGHGIGTMLHDGLHIDFYRSSPFNRNLTMKPGMIFTVEPIINAGNFQVNTNSDGTVCTKDGSLSAHFEHTVLVTSSEPEILTLPPSQNKENSFFH